jgi:hypothetical protein
MGSDGRRALRAFEGHLTEVVDMSDAAEIVDRLERTVSEQYLEDALERALAGQTHRVASLWRRDLLLISGAQFFALAAAVAALVGLG